MLEVDCFIHSKTKYSVALCEFESTKRELNLIIIIFFSFMFMLSCITNNKKSVGVCGFFSPSYETEMLITILFPLHEVVMVILFAATYPRISLTGRYPISSF